MKNRNALTALALLGAMFSAAVQAAPAEAVVVTDITGTLTNQLVPIGLVMAAGLTLAAVVVGYRWIRRAVT